jgi:hypothetical protein
VLRNDLLVLRQTTRWYEETQRSLSRLGSWIGIHVRRGDFASRKGQSFHGVLQQDYYLRALGILEDRQVDLPVVVFSDEPEEAARLVRPLARSVHTIQPPPGTPAIESLQLLAGASSIVTANSTFSWWAAWLGESEGRRVVAPHTWFSQQKNTTSDLLPPHWILT